MMHGPEKSDPAIVAGKLANKAMSPLRSILPRCRSLWSQWSEGRGPRGMRASTARTGLSAGLRVSQALERIRPIAVTHPRWEPYAGKPLVRFCAGGAR